MMRATGPLFMGRTEPLATTAANGVFALTLLAFDRMSPQRVESWRITFSGPAAQAFWQQHGPALRRPGQPLRVELERIMAFTSAREGALINAHATSIELAPWAHEAPPQPAQAAQAA